MKIIYELNPPKIVKGERFDLEVLRQDLQTMVDRATQLYQLVDGVHLTDSVLGIPRVSGITAAGFVKQESPSINISCSLRSRDRNFAALSQSVSDAILAGIERILVLYGDEPANSENVDCGLKPSTVVKMLRKEGYDSKINLDLSFPAKILDSSSPAIRSKLLAQPHSVVTQSIASIDDLGGIVDLAKANSVKVASCIMVPSEKNRASASIIGLDWSAYEKNPVDFVKQAAKMSDRVLLTSPNSFASGLELLRKIKEG